ncbi:hypothetical protein EYR40_008343 [Pleurotus pulmonarius]|nr:hypothetical protein EYR40_008343 [Pleurotus pulmonarius]
MPSFKLTAFLSLAVLLLATQIPWNMQALNALKAAHAAKPLNSPVAVSLGFSVFVGGTAGIGAALAVKTAKYSTNPNIHIVGRSKASAEKVLAELKAVNKDGQYQFHECDISLLSNARALASTLAQQLPKINLLVLTPGILSMNGRTETTEGHDVKMVLHYYSRALFIDSLVPNLKAAADAKEEARVMSVLDSLRGDYNKVLWDDMELKKSFTLGNAAQHCMAFTDVAVQRFSRLHPSISFQHAYPSLVATDIGRSLPWYAAGPLSTLSKVFGSAAENTAEFFFDALVNPAMATGPHFVDSKGKEVQKADSPEDVQEKIWEHTRSVIEGIRRGIGAALAVKAAKHSVNPDIHIVGRNRASAEKVLAELRAANPNGTYHFQHECDVALLSNGRTLATTLSRQLPKINLLVLTAGMLSFSGPTETSEGNDVRMVVHYYSRMFFIDALLPNLQATATGLGNARVMSVLNGTEGHYRKLLWDDLDSQELVYSRKRESVFYLNDGCGFAISTSATLANVSAEKDHRFLPDMEGRSQLTPPLSETTAWKGTPSVSCRRRKVKCDGIKPICGACSRSLGSFSDCEYVESGHSQTQIMEESIALIESRIRELESPDASNHSVTLQNPYPFAGPSTSVQSSSMTINMDMFLGGVAWTRPTAYNALSGVALPSPIPASMGPNEPRGVINIGLRQEEPPAAIMQALVHTFIHHSAEIGCFLNIPRLLEVTDHPDANVRPLPALMVAIYLWGIRLCNSAEFNDYEELYLSRAVDQAAQSLPLDRPRKVLQKIQAEILLAYFFFSKGRNVEGRYHTSIVIGAILGSQLHKYGGLEQGEGICATFWSPTTDLIDHGERIDAVWAAVVLTNTWSAVLAAPSDIPFNSPGFTIDAPWPLDTYGDMALQSLPVSNGTIQKFLREPTVAEGRSIKAFLAKAAVLLERASYLHSQYRSDAPENETAGLKNSIPILDNVIEAYLASGLPRLDQASNPSDRMNITLAHTIVHAARIKLQSTRVLGYDVAPRKKVLQAAEGVLEIAHQNLLQEPDFVNPIFGHLWTICALAYISEIERMRTGDSVTDVTEIHLLQKVDKLVELMAKFADRFCWRGSMETIEVARTKSSR